VVGFSSPAANACVDIENPSNETINLRTLVLQAHAESDVVVYAVVDKSHLGPIRREKYYGPVRDYVVHWRVIKQWKCRRINALFRTSETFGTCTRTYEDGSVGVLYFESNRRGSFVAFVPLQYDLGKRSLFDQVTMLDAEFGGR
jgi:hypothetical protein